MPLSPAEITSLTQSLAAQVQQGRWDHLLPEDWPQIERVAFRIATSDEFDAWLISWVPGRSTELHDHAGSAGALTVVTGSVAETSFHDGTLQHRIVGPNETAYFHPTWIHDVTRNNHATDTFSSANHSLPTLTVHAYSPPLTAMSYYRLTVDNRVIRVRSEITSEPESTSPIPTGIDSSLELARAGLHRVTAETYSSETKAGARVIDIRPLAQRSHEGEIPGAIVLERNVLEWRLDPSSPAHIPEAKDWDIRWVIACSEGYASSLAAASLRQLGLHRATDLDGGFHALKNAGLIG